MPTFEGSNMLRFISCARVKPQPPSVWHLAFQPVPTHALEPRAPAEAATSILPGIPHQELEDPSHKAIQERFFAARRFRRKEGISPTVSNTQPWSF